MKGLLLVLIIFLAPNVLACSCGRIATIEETINSRPILVQVKVKSLESFKGDDSSDGIYGATVEIIKVLKGQVESSEIEVRWYMCYASITPIDMKIDNVYIFPFNKVFEEPYQLAGCAHSGLELKGDDLYTYELTNNGGRELKFYMKYDDFLRKYGI